MSNERYGTRTNRALPGAQQEQKMTTKENTQHQCAACGEQPGRCWSSSDHVMIDDVGYLADDCQQALYDAGIDSTPVLRGCGCDEIETSTIVVYDVETHAKEDGWQPTHRITVRDAAGTIADIVLVDLRRDLAEDGCAPAYTAAEHVSETGADWGAERGEWKFQDRAHPSTGTVEIEQIGGPLTEISINDEGGGRWDTSRIQPWVRDEAGLRRWIECAVQDAASAYHGVDGEIPESVTVCYSATAWDGEEIDGEIQCQVRREGLASLGEPGAPGTVAALVKAGNAISPMLTDLKHEQENWTAEIDAFQDALARAGGKK